MRILTNRDTENILKNCKVRENKIKKIMYHIKSFQQQEYSEDDFTLIVMNFFCVSYEELKSTRRDRKLVYARMIVAYFLRVHNLETLESIGKKINRNHSTVIHLLKKFDQEMDYRDFRGYLMKIFIKANLPIDFLIK